MADEKKPETDLGQMHPNVGPLLEAMLLTRSISHDEPLGCLVMLFRGKQFRLIMDESLDIPAIMEALEAVLHDMKNQKPLEVDADTPFTGGDTPRLQ